MAVDKPRCPWAEKDDLMMKYHDKEWGKPLHHDGKLFELLILEGMQAGLSWQTVLRKRESFRKAFDDFQPEKIVRYSDKKIAELLKNEGIIRNRSKILATIKNAKAFLAIKEDLGFDRYIWQFTKGDSIQNQWRRMQQVPASTKESDAMSKDLKKRGFTFVGTTICYAYMQAIGMVNDHLTDCFRYGEILRMK